VAILLVALALRIGAVAATHHFHPVNDPADYERHALSIAAGDGYPPSVYAPGGGPSALRAPLYPYVLGAVYWISGRTAARLMEALVGTLVVGLIGLLALEIFDRRTASVAMALAAVYPPLILVNATLISESLALPLIFGALLAMIRQRRADTGVGWAILAGLLTGLATLDRPAAVVLVVPLVWSCWPKRGLRWARALAVPALALGVAILTVAPWTIRNAVEMHAFIPVSDEDGDLLSGTYNDTSRHDHTFPAAHRPYTLVAANQDLVHSHLREAELFRRLRSRALRYAGDHPGYIATVAYWNTRRLFELGGGPAWGRTSYAYVGIGRRPAKLAVGSFYPVALLALYGIVLAIRRRAGYAFLWTAPVLLFISVVLIGGDLRYRLPLDVFFVLWAALALSEIGGRFGAARRTVPGA